MTEIRSQDMKDINILKTILTIKNFYKIETHKQISDYLNKNLQMCEVH